MHIQQQQHGPCELEREAGDERKLGLRHAVGGMSKAKKAARSVKKCTDSGAHCNSKSAKIHVSTVRCSRTQEEVRHEIDPGLVIQVHA